MAAALGKTCGTCNMCCKVLEIEEFPKPAGRLCEHCTSGSGCGIYMTRPQVCRDFMCEWLAERSISSTLKPDRIGALFMVEADTENYLAVCDPAKPQAWRHPLVMRHLLAMAREGHVVVAKAGLLAWRIYPTGECSPWA